eukprot:scaffold11822_cov120-Isochrysis_galbana.AAC.7
MCAAEPARRWSPARTRPPASVSWRSRAAVSGWRPSHPRTRSPQWWWWCPRQGVPESATGGRTRQLQMNRPAKRPDGQLGPGLDTQMIGRAFRAEGACAPA